MEEAEPSSSSNASGCVWIPSTVSVPFDALRSLSAAVAIVVSCCFLRLSEWPTCGFAPAAAPSLLEGEFDASLSSGLL